MPKSVRRLPRCWVVCFYLTAAAQSWAATITWGPATTVTGAVDVDTQGTLVFAYDESNAGQVVNGVSFAAGSSAYALGGGDVTFSGFDGGVYDGFGPGAGGGISTAYSNVLAGGAWGPSAGSGTVTLNNLTVGRTYQVQCWVGDYRSYGLTRYETLSGNNGPTLRYSPAQYAVGTFTADDASQSFTLSANASAQINALQVRDVTTNAGPTAGGWANPAELVIGETALVTLAVTNGADSSITNVMLDASQIGATPPIALNPAGGNVFTNSVTVGAGTLYGNQALTVTVIDGAGQQGQATIPVYLTPPAPFKASPPAFEAWRSNRFGMFIHWGPVTLTGLEISWSRANSNPQCPNNGPTPVDVYDHLYTRFNPTGFNASNWVAIAQAAGMTYLVLTAKHCDGFLLWDSQASDYNISNSPFHRDVCGELAAAAHAAGMELGWYFSPCDWKDPRFRTAKNGAFVKTMQAELRELLSHYGKIDILWFDTDGYTNAYDVADTYAMCRRLQPGIVIDNRLDMGSGAAYDAQAIGPWADYYTPEQRIGAFDNQRPWETCMTLGTQWAWKPNDTIKSLSQCLSTLLLCAGGDGNLLLDLGPTSTGAFEQRYSDSIAGIGAWLIHHGESVYGTRGGPYEPGGNFASTRRDNQIYLHLFPPQPSVILSALPTNILSAAVLTGGSVSFKQTGQSIALQLSPDAITSFVATVKLTLAGSAMNIPVLPPGTLHATPTTNTWQTPQPIGDSSEVDTQGTLVIARQASGSNYGGNADQTVHGVTFLGNVDTQNGVTFSVGGQTGYNPTTFISAKALSGPDATAYEDMLAGAWYGGTVPVTLGLNGLRIGHDYSIQIWVADFRQYTNSRSETVTVAGGTDIHAPTLLYLTGDGSDPGSGKGEYVLGTFIATGPSATFDLTGNESSQLNAFQLRDITPLSPARLSWSQSATELTLAWPADHLGWTLLMQTNHLDLGPSASTSDWLRIAGSSATNQITFPLDETSPVEFYRLIYP